MPFKSKAQMRMMFAKEERGEVVKGTAKRWAKETKNIDNLPEHVKQAQVIQLFTKLAERLINTRPVPAAIALQKASAAERDRKQKGMNIVEYRNYLAQKRNVVTKGSSPKGVPH